MKKVIPVLVAIVLIILVGAIAIVPQFLEKYSYSKEQADLEQYFGVSGDTAAIYLQDTKLEDTGLIRDGGVYLPLSVVETYMTQRFYYNENEQALKFTLPEKVHTVYLGVDAKVCEVSSPDLSDTELSYITYDYPVLLREGEDVYLAAEYLKKYSSFTYALYDAPYRIQLFVTDDQITTATLTEDQAIRIKAGIKCEVLEDMKKGDTLVVMPAEEQRLEDWTLVKSPDCMIGYVETKFLENQKEVSRGVSSDFVDIVYPRITRDHKICLGWHSIAGEGGNSTLKEVIANAGPMNVISPTWLYVSGSEGGLYDISSASYVETAHANGLEVWVLAEDFTQENKLNDLLKSTDTRIALENNLVNAVLAVGADGLNIDFEYILSENGDHFGQFLRELSILTHKYNLVLSVDNYPPQGGWSQYRRDEQGIVADYVILMGYDEHTPSGGTAGSVASLDFVETGIYLMINNEGVPADKLINGLPFYTRIWQTEGTDVTCTTVDMQTSFDWISNHGITTEWDETTCQNYGQLQSGTALFEVWLEDTASLQVKLSIMEKYNLAGAAAWRLGLETSDVWSLLEAYMNY